MGLGILTTARARLTPDLAAAGAVARRRAVFVRFFAAVFFFFAGISHLPGTTAASVACPSRFGARMRGGILHQPGDARQRVMTAGMLRGPLARMRRIRVRFKTAIEGSSYK